MLYMRCPTCKTLLGDKQIYYERHMADICKKAEEGHYKSSADEEKAKSDLVKSLGLNPHRYCCIMRVLTYVKQVEIVK